MFLRGLFFLAIIVINLLLYGIFQDDLIFGLLLFAQSVLLYFNFVSGGFFTKLPAFIVLIILIPLSLYKDFDRTFIYPSALEADVRASRHEYFAFELGKLFNNRVSITYTRLILPLATKFNKNMFSHLAFDSLLNVQSIFSLISVPLFLLGIFKAAYGVNKFIVFYLSAVFIIGGLLTFAGRYGSLLYVPMINLLIYLGSLQVIHSLQARSRRIK